MILKQLSTAASVGLCDVHSSGGASICKLVLINFSLNVFSFIFVQRMDLGSSARNFVIVFVVCYYISSGFKE